ncbi:MAG TPA: hypothetical protein VGK13_02970 [Methanocellaceae archaeon]
MTALVFGCITHAQPSPNNVTYGYKFFNFNQAHDWKYNVTMAAGGVNSTWNMSVHQENETINGSIMRHFIVETIGNGMNITYDVLSNASTYQVTNMHAKGSIGDFYQDKDTSTLQVNTIPDFGLIYYFVPFSPVKQITVVGQDGRTAPATLYAATDNKGFTVAYLVNPTVPVPLKIEATDKNCKVTSMLTEVR